MTVVDLACGAGSNPRALAPFLGPRQSWRLVDHDAGLLASARAALTAWADAVEGEEPLALHKNGRRLTFAFQRLDLNADLAGALEGAELVTAAAFSISFRRIGSSVLRRTRAPPPAALCSPDLRRARELDAAARGRRRHARRLPPPSGARQGVWRRRRPRSSAMLRETLERHGLRSTSAPARGAWTGRRRIDRRAQRGRGGGRRANRPRRRGGNRRLARGPARGARLPNRACRYFRFPRGIG